MSAEPAPNALVVRSVTKTFRVPRDVMRALMERAMDPFRRVLRARLQARDTVDPPAVTLEVFNEADHRVLAIPCPTPPHLADRLSPGGAVDYRVRLVNTTTTGGIVDLQVAREVNVDRWTVSAQVDQMDEPVGAY